MRLDSARNEIVQADTKSIGKSPKRVNGAGPASRFDVNDLYTAGVGGAGKSRLRQAAVFAPDTERRLAIDQPIGDRRRKELLGPSGDEAGGGAGAPKGSAATAAALPSGDAPPRRRAPAR